MSGARSVRIIRGDKRYKSRNTPTGLGFVGNCPSITLSERWGNGYVGEVFLNGICDVLGGVGPHQIVVESGSIPDGLTIDTESYEENPGDWIFELYGSPTTFGSYTFTVGGTDANGCPITSKEFTVEVKYADVEDFVARVQSDGSDVTGTLLTKYNNFMTDIWSIRNRIIRLNLFQTDSFAGIFNPLFLGDDVNNPVGNSTDTNNNFVSGDWVATGLTGNGTTKYIDTGVVLQTVFAQNNMAMGVFNTEVGDILCKDIGAESSIYAYVGVYWSGLGGTFATCNEAVNDAVTQGVGLVGVSRTGPTSKRLYSGGNTATSASASTGEVNYSCYVFASNSAGTPSLISPRKLKGYFLGVDFGLSDFQTLETAVANFYS